jgi:hypothetical protein
MARAATEAKSPFAGISPDSGLTLGPQDIAHGDGAYKASRRSQRPGRRYRWPVFS